MRPTSVRSWGLASRLEWMWENGSWSLHTHNHILPTPYFWTNSQYRVKFYVLLSAYRGGWLMKRGVLKHNLKHYPLTWDIMCTLYTRASRSFSLSLSSWNSRAAVFICTEAIHENESCTSSLSLFWPSSTSRVAVFICTEAMYIIYSRLQLLEPFLAFL